MYRGHATKQVNQQTPKHITSKTTRGKESGKQTGTLLPSEQIFCVRLSRSNAVTGNTSTLVW